MTQKTIETTIDKIIEKTGAFRRSSMHKKNFLRALKTAVAIFAASILFLCLPSFAAAEQVYDEQYGYTLDLPEGFFISDATPDGSSIAFAHDRVPVTLILRLYDGTTDATAQLLASLAKLRATYDEPQNFEWRNVNCAITTFSWINGEVLGGWSLSVPLVAHNATLVLLCYVQEEIREHVEQFIISCINSLAIDYGSYYTAGPVTTYAFPKTQNIPVELEIDGKKITTQLDKDDAEAAQFLVECEYAVLSLYTGNAKWKEAWQRYYRLIFRDSTGRVKKCAFDIYNALSLSSDEADKNSSNLSLIKKLLAWTQNFEYKRGKINSSDFTSIPACILGEGNDCDSRAMLLCALAQNMNIKTALFVSREYAHALFGVASDDRGAKIEVDGTEYLLGETTAHVDLGLVAAEMSVTEKWIPVIW